MGDAWSAYHARHSELLAEDAARPREVRRGTSDINNMAMNETVLRQLREVAAVMRAELDSLA